MRNNWSSKPPHIAIPMTLLPRSFNTTTNVLATGQYAGKPYDWVIRNDQQYCQFLMKKELQDELGNELSIFAHYCLETPQLAKTITTKEVTKKGGINNMVTTTFTGFGRAMKTGAATISHFSMTANDILETPQRFKGYTVDPNKLRMTIQQIKNGELSLDELSWLWEDTNFIVTGQNEVFYIFHQ